jgi:hypothetical protein
MTRTVRKVFFIWEFEKEEKWLNEMSAIGLQLCAVGFCTYHFEEGTPGEYVYRLEMLENWPTHAKSMQYIRFLEDTGIEHVGSLLRWVYFRKKTGGDTFDLFSDISSRITHFNRMLLLVGVLSAVNLINALNIINMWTRSRISIALTTAILCFAIFMLLGYGFIRIYLMRRKLNKEKALRE